MVLELDAALVMTGSCALPHMAALTASWVAPSMGMPPFRAPHKHAHRERAHLNPSTGRGGSSLSHRPLHPKPQTLSHRPRLVHSKQGCNANSLHLQARPGMGMPQGPVDANGLSPSLGMPPFMPPPNPHARMQGPEGRLRQQYEGPARAANGLVALDDILQGSQGPPTSAAPQVWDRVWGLGFGVWSLVSGV